MAGKVEAYDSAATVASAGSGTMTGAGGGGGIAGAAGRHDGSLDFEVTLTEWCCVLQLTREGDQPRAWGRSCHSSASFHPTARGEPWHYHGEGDRNRSRREHRRRTGDRQRDGNRRGVEQTDIRAIGGSTT